MKGYFLLYFCLSSDTVLTEVDDSGTMIMRCHWLKENIYVIFTNSELETNSSHTTDHHTPQAT